MDRGPAQAPTDVLRGATLVALAVLLFAMADVLTKQMTTVLPVPLVMFFRYLSSFIVVVAVLGPGLGRRMWATRRTGLVLLRALTLAAASLTMGIALRHLPVAETVAIIYLSPFAVLMLSVPILGERVALASWLFAGLGFAGVLAILRPGGGLDPFGVTFALVNAGLATAYHLLTRILSRTETTAALMFHTMLAGLVVFLPFAAMDLATAQPRAGQLALMIALGLLATGGHFLFTAAYRHAPAATLAPINYLHLVWAGLLGWLVFGHVPDGWSLLGMSAVIGAGVGLAVVARAQAVDAARPPA